MLRSVRSRLTLWYAGVLTCTLLLLSVVIYWIFSWLLVILKVVLACQKNNFVMNCSFYY